MKWMIAALILVGLIAAAAAAVLAVTLHMDFSPAAPVVTKQTRVVLVAARPLDAMTVVDSSVIAQEEVEIPTTPKPAGEEATESAVSFSHPSQIIGRILLTPLLKGQQFNPQHFASSASGLQLASAIPAGERAMSILLADDSGIEHLLYPGSTVDVVASFRLPASDGNMSGEVVSVTLLQGMRVLAVGGRTVMSETEPVAGSNASTSQTEVSGAAARRGRMVTLQVNTTQAEALQLAATHGKVSLSLRNPLDNSRAMVAGTRISELSADLAERIQELASGQSPRTRLPAVPDLGAAAATKTEEPAKTVDPVTAPKEVASAAPIEPPSTISKSRSSKPKEWHTTVIRGHTKSVEKFELSEPEAVARAPADSTAAQPQ